MPLMLAGILQMEPQVQGWCATADSDLVIVCRRSLGEWYPLYAMKLATAERVGLPSCFSLLQELEDALETVYIAEMEDQINGE